MNYLTRTGLALLASCVGFTGTATAQDLSVSRDHLVTIEVAEDRVYTLAHVIRIEAETARIARTRDELDHREWRAIRQSELGEETLSSRDCASLRRAVTAFQSLPPLTILPPSMRVHPDPVPIPPGILDGYSTRLRFRTLTPDGSEALIELRGGNAYASWANDTVSSLTECWGSVRPQPVVTEPLPPIAPVR